MRKIPSVVSHPSRGLCPCLQCYVGAATCPRTFTLVLTERGGRPRDCDCSRTSGPLPPQDGSPCPPAPSLLEHGRGASSASTAFSACTSSTWTVPTACDIRIHHIQHPKSVSTTSCMNPTSSPADNPLCKVGESNQHNLLSYCAAPQQLWSTHSSRGHLRRGIAPD